MTKKLEKIETREKVFTGMIGLRTGPKYRIVENPIKVKINELIDAVNSLKENSGKKFPISK